MKIIFATDNEPLSKIVRTLNNCRWHHVGVLFNDYVIEARFSGVMKTQVEYFKIRGSYEIVDYPVNDEGKALDFALNQISKKYDLPGLLSFPFRARWQNSTRWYCSELVAAIADAGGSPLVRSDLNGVSPRDLWVMQHNKTIISHQQSKL